MNLTQSQRYLLIQSLTLSSNYFRTNNLSNLVVVELENEKKKLLKNCTHEFPDGEIAYNEDRGTCLICNLKIDVPIGYYDERKDDDPLLQ